MNLLPHLLFLIFGASLSAQRTELSVKSEFLQQTIAVTLVSFDPVEKDLPIVYITDGRKAIDFGLLAEIERLTKAGTALPAHYVFVSTIDDEGTDHRNGYFFCNSDYLKFFTEELLPSVEGKLNAHFTPADRSLVGISFGGLNAAYFASRNAPFRNYALLSPVTYPCPELAAKIAFGPQRGQRIFLSTGHNDAEQYVSQLKGLYASKEHDVERLETAGGHDFGNWLPQLKQVLPFLLKEIPLNNLPKY